MPEDETNRYSISLYDSSGSLVELDENSANAIEYTVGFEQQIILPHTLGLGLYDDTLFILAKEGSRLPYHNMSPFKTTAEVTKDDENSFISMPLYNGTAKVASNNEKVGELLISGADVRKTILKGSEITITVDIDKSRVMTFDVNVLDIGQTFDFEIDPSIQKFTFDEVNNKFIKAKSDYESIKLKCSTENINEEIESYLAQIEEENIIENINGFLESAENDEGALNQANKLINKLNEILNNITKYFDNKSEIEEVLNLREEVRDLVNANGTKEEEDEFENLSRQLDEAIENEDSFKIDQIKNSLLGLKASCIDDPVEELKKALLYLMMFAEYRDEDASLVSDLKQQASDALNNDDVPQMANVAQKLMNLAIIDTGNQPPFSSGGGGGVNKL